MQDSLFSSRPILPFPLFFNEEIKHTMMYNIATQNYLEVYMSSLSENEKKETYLFKMRT